MGVSSLLEACFCTPANNSLDRHERLITLSKEEHPRYKDIKSSIPRLESRYSSEDVYRVCKQDWLNAVDEYNRALLEPDILPEFFAKKRLLGKKITALHTVRPPNRCGRCLLNQGRR